jgi:uncharacterized RmlC-like cupin family protein
MFEPIEVLGAWYGVETGTPEQARKTHETEGVVLRTLKEQAARNGGFLALNGSHHVLFGTDPLPGVPKVVGIHVRGQSGGENHLRVKDGQQLIYPPNVPPELAQYALANSAGVQAAQPNQTRSLGGPAGFDPIIVLGAWYGVENGTPDQQARTMQTTAVVTERLRANVAQSGGFLAIPTGHHIYLGMDPLPGVVKVLAVNVKNTRTGAESHLRVQDGKAFIYPPEVPFEQGQRALASVSQAIAQPVTMVQPVARGFTTFDPITVLGAWYGVENGNPDQKARTEQTTAVVSEKLRANAAQNGGFLAIPAGHHIYLGMDPLPGVVKVIAICVKNTRTGAESHLRVQDGQPFVYPPEVPHDASQRALATVSAQVPQAGAVPRAAFDSITVQGAWYGVENGTPDQKARTEQTTAVVTEKLRANVARNGGFLAIPSGHHIYLGMDPLPGVVKVIAVCVRNNRTGAESHLRVQDGQPFVYPPEVPQDLGRRALTQ